MKNGKSVLPLVKVESAFNGLAVYDMKTVFPALKDGSNSNSFGNNECQYTGAKKGADGSALSHDALDCEHVAFHSCLMKENK